MILLIDHFDSFSFNIYQAFSKEDVDMKVVRSNHITIQEIERLKPEAIIFSPGPKSLEKTAICIEIIQTFYKTVPMLGISLGHHMIASAFGASSVEANTIKHGKTAMITHDGTGIFSYLSQPLEVMLYHSYVLAKETLPEVLNVTATSLDAGEIMAIKHRKYPVYGVQFHPESIGTIAGKEIIHNFLKEIRGVAHHETVS